MKLVSNSRYIKDALLSYLFRHQKEDKIKNALSSLGNFSDNVEIRFVNASNKDLVYVLDKKGNVYTFTLDYNEGLMERPMDNYILEQRIGDVFYLYNYFYSNVEKIGKGYYLDDGAIITAHKDNGYMRRYTLEKDQDHYSFTINYSKFLLEPLKEYALLKDYNLDNFIDVCRSLNVEPNGKGLIEFYNEDTTFKAHLLEDTVTDYELSINNLKEIINLTYKDGELTESYKVIQEIDSSKLPLKRQVTVNKMKRLVRN